MFGIMNFHENICGVFCVAKMARSKKASNTVPGMLSQWGKKLN
jgi:hypothetical protein